MRAVVASPAGVVAATRTAVAIADPLDAGAIASSTCSGRTPGSTRRPARSYVDYDFSLDSGDYKTTYDFNGVPNVDGERAPGEPRGLAVTTPAYTQHLLSRWVTDRMTLRTGPAPSVDILDGDKAQVGAAAVAAS